MIIKYLYNNRNNNTTITGKNSKSRYPFYDKFTPFFFVPFVSLILPAIAMAFYLFIFKKTRFFRYRYDEAKSHLFCF